MTSSARNADTSSVLIADDDADIRELVLIALRNAGFEADTADGGIEALALAQRTQRRVIVLDVRMPDMSGLEVCRQLKGSQPDNGASVLLISANSSTEDVAAGFAAGADDYLAKPFSPRELVHRVALLVSGSRSD